MIKIDMSHLTSEQNKDLFEYRNYHIRATNADWIRDYEERHKHDVLDEKGNPVPENSVEINTQKSATIKPEPKPVKKQVNKPIEKKPAKPVKPKQDRQDRNQKQKEQDRKLKLKAENQKTTSKFKKQKLSNTELASKAEVNSDNNSGNTKEQSKYATLRNVPRPIVEFCKSEIPGVLQTDAVSAYILAMSNNRIVDLDHQISDEVRELAANFRKSDPYFVEQDTIKQISRKSDNIQNLIFSLLTLQSFYIGTARFGFGSNQHTMPQSLTDIEQLDFDSDFVEQIIESVNEKAKALLKEMRNREGSNMRY